MDLWPAIDLRRGRVVRLRRGADASRTVYSSDPVAVMERWIGAGCERVHIVDLDAAFGEPPQRPLLADLVRRGGPDIQLGGGLRDRVSVLWALEAGFSRAVLGSLAVRRPEVFAALADELPGRLVAAIEYRRDELVVEGWRTPGGVAESEVLARLAGVPASALVTDVDRDGMLSGPNVPLALRVSAATGMPAIVSGGVRSVDDVRHAQRSGLGGAIVGRALYEGWLSLEAALLAARPESAA